MTSKREYGGAALSSLIVGLSDHQAVLDKLLADAGVRHVDPALWYDYDWVVDLFDKIENEIGPMGPVLAYRNTDRLEVRVSGELVGGDEWRLADRSMGPTSGRGLFVVVASRPERHAPNTGTSRVQSSRAKIARLD